MNIVQISYNAQFTIIATQIYLDPSGGECEPEEGIDREDEESGFEVTQELYACCL